MIHKTAIIDSKAQIDTDVEIGAFSVIKGDTIIKKGTKIEHNVTIDSFTEIGENCKIFQYASIGGPPQAIKYKGEKTHLKIGAQTTIREFVTINRGTEFGGGITEVGENNFLMAYCHIAHDCKTGKNTIFANNATLAGHITVGNNVIIGGLVAIHQFVKIGNHAYIGGKSAVVKDIPPYAIAVGDRATLRGLNKVGLQRHGFSEQRIAALKKAYRIIFRIGLSLKEAIERVKAEAEQTDEVIEFINFIQNSERGITR
ncbi:MAG: acyl-ACP--UDP-N-acetylglucosamine O-acyltransferase [Deltaproteobacteria bacterium]|nr:acyl-ACP--UDP-N-acetylglucosamine O-acyltransferase [Deltaproteobacteria bacterium]